MADREQPSGEPSPEEARRIMGRRSLSGSGIGWAMVADILTGTFLWGGIGFLADRWLGTEPWLMVTGFVVGHVIGIYAATLHAKRMRR